MYETSFSDITEIPFCFIRGVKTNCKSLEYADMMRGEETEISAIFCGEGIYVLSGSHSKIVKADVNGSIVDFKTMLTGEMISALRENTILKSTVELEGQGINEKSLVEGFEYARAHGINDALFKVRVLKNIFGKSSNEVYNFFLGAVLCGEIVYVLNEAPKKVVVSGQVQIKEAVVTLLKSISDIEVVAIPDEVSAFATAKGMVKIFEYSKIN
jgi:2-keto-3-deoxy-galactonokinase